MNEQPKATHILDIDGYRAWYRVNVSGGVFMFKKTEVYIEGEPRTDEDHQCEVAHVHEAAGCVACFAVPTRFLTPIGAGGGVMTKLTPQERRVLADLPAFRTDFGHPYENRVADQLVRRGLALRQPIAGTNGHEYQQTRKAPRYLAQHGAQS